MKAERWAFLLASAMIACPTSSSAVWDFTADFSVTNSNPNGAWTYGIKHAANLSGPVLAFPDSGNDGTWMFWNDLAHIQLGAPACAKNLSTSWINGIAPGEAQMHPGPSDEVTTTRFTAPAAGTYHIFGKFGAGDGGAVDVYVYHNGASLLTEYATIIESGWDWILTMSGGDTVDFMVGNAGSFYYDSTPLYARIEAVPEPSSLVALAAATLLLSRRSKR